MKLFVLIFLIFLSATSVVFSQEKFISHQISKGETISTIAEKYKVSQKSILEFNPKAAGILKLKDVLKIPNKNFKSVVALREVATKKKATKRIEYVVLAKETLFGIAKKFNLSVDEIKVSNPAIAKEGLKNGSTIQLIVPEHFELPVEIVDAEKTMEADAISAPNTDFVAKNTVITDEKTALLSHDVVALETKYGIAKRYGLTVIALEQLNPTIVAKQLEIGQVLRVPFQEIKKIVLANDEGAAKADVLLSAPINAVQNSVRNENTAAASNEVVLIMHEVMPKETKFGIAKKYGITVNDLEKLNPSIPSTLKVGLLLKINEAVTSPAAALANDTSKANSDTVVRDNSNKVFGDFAVADELIEKASDHLGIRYRSGGTSSSGFDCSGLMISTFGALDIQLPRTSVEQSNIGYKIGLQEAKKGDLIFFKTRGSGRINHVGMVIGVEGDDVKFIHSSTSNGVIISSTKENYYHRNFAQVNRVLK